MQKDNVKLNRFISEITSGEPAPIPTDEAATEKAIWSGDKTELEQQTYSFYAAGNAGAPRFTHDEWFIFSDEKTEGSLAGDSLSVDNSFGWAESA